MRLTGWKAVGSIPESVKKFVIVAVPHTSNFDYPYTMCGKYLIGIGKVRYLIKNELYKFPFKYIVDWTGGMPVDRSKKNSLVDQVVEMFQAHEQFGLIIAVEGTRSYSKEWKSGFYHIANNANVPIVCGFIDFFRKEVGIGPILYPTGDMAADIEKMKRFYQTKIPRYLDLSSIDHILPEGMNREKFLKRKP